MEGPPNEPVRTEFAAQGGEFAAIAIAEDGFGNAQCAAKSRDNTADGGDFYLRGGVAHQKNLAVADAPAHGNPLFVNRNARTLPLERLHIFLLQKALDAALGVAAVFTNDAQRAAFRGFGNQPVEIRRVVRDEPDARGVRGAILGQAHDGLHQRYRFDGWPAGSASDATGGAIGADQAVRVEFFATATRFHLYAEPSAIRRESQKARIKIKRGAGLLRIACQRRNQARALDDEIRPAERDLRGTAVGKKFKSANFVDDAFFGCGSQLIAEMIGYDERARRRRKTGLGLQHANPPPTVSNFCSRK